MMRAGKIALAVCALSLVGVGLTPHAARAQGRFNDRDRQELRDWYRDHGSSPELQGQRRWNFENEQRLQPGSVIDPDVRRWVRPAPPELYRRLAPAPRGMRYVVIGDHVALIDRSWRVVDAYHFERFDDRDQATSRDWYRDHRGDAEFRDRDRWNDGFERRMQPGMVLDADLRAMARPVPQELLRRLPPQPRAYQYVVIGDHILLVDNWWSVREVVHFERQP